MLGQRADIRVPHSKLPKAMRGGELKDGFFTLAVSGAHMQTMKLHPPPPRLKTLNT